MTPRRISTLLLGLFASALVLFAAVSPAFAQTEGRNSETGFVQCTSTFPTGGTDDGVGGSCDLCDLMQLINNATFYAVSFVMIIATAFILVSGFLYLTSGGDEHRLSQAKNSLKFAIVGMIIALLAGIIVKTIMFRVFPGQNPGLGTFVCSTEAAPTAPGAPGTGEPGTPPPPGGEPPAADEYSSADAKSKLQAAGIDPQSANFNGIKQVTVDDMVAFVGRSGCNGLNVNSAVRNDNTTFQYSHANGYKLDIAPNNCMSNYIESNFTCFGTRGGDNAQLWRDPVTNNVYADEGDHWDIAFCRGQCNNAGSIIGACR